jgi:hypothetical protein
VSREIRKILTERASNFNIALDDVSITSLSFGKEFTHAIEAKQVAAQEAERAKFIVEKAEQDKRSAIIRAQVSKDAMDYCWFRWLSPYSLISLLPVVLVIIVKTYQWHCLFLHCFIYFTTYSFSDNC